MSQINVDTINEQTSSSGITIDGVLIKDNKLASGTGNVLQVVTATDTSGTQIAQNSYTDTGLSANITPSATSSKILVMVNTNVRVNRNAYYDITALLRVLRDSTQIINRYVMIRGSSSQNSIATSSDLTVLDSPSTTSQITYKLQAYPSTTDSGGYVETAYSDSVDTITLIEIGG